NRRSGPLVYSNSLLSSPPSSSRLRGPSANVSSAIPQHTPARKNPVQEKNVEISIEPDRTLALTSAKKLSGTGLPRKSLTVKTRITPPTALGGITSPLSAGPGGPAS